MKYRIQSISGTLYEHSKILNDIAEKEEEYEFPDFYFYYDEEKDKSLDLKKGTKEYNKYVYRKTLEDLEANSEVSNIVFTENKVTYLWTFTTQYIEIQSIQELIKLAQEINRRIIVNGSGVLEIVDDYL